jgi:hypothetical protein
MTRVPELMAAGVTVAFGLDCVMDPWYSLGCVVVRCRAGELPWLLGKKLALLFSDSAFAIAFACALAFACAPAFASALDFASAPALASPPAPAYPRPPRNPRSLRQ